MSDKPQVYYDGGCPVCAGEIALYKLGPAGNTFAWVDVNRPDATLGPNLTQAEALARMHVRRADGTLLSGAAAFAEIWRHMPRLKYFGRLFAIPPFGLLAEVAYRAFLLTRRAWR